MVFPQCTHAAVAVSATAPGTRTRKKGLETGEPRVTFFYIIDAFSITGKNKKVVGHVLVSGSGSSVRSSRDLEKGFSDLIQGNVASAISNSAGAGWSRVKAVDPDVDQKKPSCISVYPYDFPLWKVTVKVKVTMYFYTYEDGAFFFLIKHIYFQFSFNPKLRSSRYLYIQRGKITRRGET